jgi:hypothetical protein
MHKTKKNSERVRVLKGKKTPEKKRKKKGRRAVGKKKKKERDFNQTSHARIEEVYNFSINLLHI